jgi:hypothetical protein
MYEIIPNHAKNRIYYRMDGFLKDEEVREVVDRMIEEIKQLRPGFDLINDLSTFKPATPEGAKEIERMVQFSIERKVRHVIRVAGPDVISRMQFDRINRLYGSSNVVEYATSREEAERRLDALSASSRG